MSGPTPFIYDAESLSQLASEKAFRQGLFYFKQDRVMESYLSEDTLYALVECSEQELPLALEMNYAPQGELQCWCDCGQAPVCQHGIAALLKYADDRVSDDQDTLSAMETAIADRIKRGQTEVRVKHLSGHPCFGIWQAQSITSDHPWPQSYEVHLRSLQQRSNFCTCPDRANNQLGTCKHIEAVLHRIKKEFSEQAQQRTAPLPFVYWDQQNGGQVRLQRTDSLDVALTSVLDRYFDTMGRFKGELPQDFFRFCDAVYGNEAISVGIDARQGVERLASRQAQELKAQKIHSRIMQSGGRLAGLRAELYPYQVEGVAFLAARGRALLADDMGLGKTLQAIAAATWLIEKAAVKRVMILCPASLKQQWAREIEKFTGHSVQVVQGNAEQRQAQYRQDKTFFVLNYELLLRDLSILNQSLQPDLLILDEAQRIKNWKTRIATAVKRISADYAFVLTGTPLENRLEDLYSLMQVVDQHLLGPLWRYLNDYHILDEKGKVKGYRNLAQLRQLIAPVMLRRNRTIVSDQLPGRTTTRLDVPMTARQKELHDSALNGAAQLAQIAKKRPLTPSEQNRMMAALQQARMACNAAGLVDKETEGSPKLTELKTLIQELCLQGGQKMVVFSQWRGMTLMVEAMLRAMGVGFVHLNGQVPSHKRGELIDRFNRDDSVSVFISTDAGGSGLNLQAASVLVNLDIPWNPAVLEQRNARVHRLGQRQKVQIILILAADSYEQRIMQLLGNKQQLFDNVVSGEDGEDVLGITTRSISALVEELAKQTSAAPQQAVTAAEKDAETDTKGSGKVSDAPDDKLAGILADDPALQDALQDQALCEGIAQAQQYFTGRLQSVQVQGGGLLMVLDLVQEQDESFIDTLTLPVPVALLDVRSLRQLQRLGGVLMNANPASSTASARKWQKQAKDKLRAAQVLMEHDNAAAVVELLCSALGAHISDILGLNELMASADIPVWLFDKAVPQGLFDATQAMGIARLLGLRLSDNIPDELLQQLYQDTAAIIQSHN